MERGSRGPASREIETVRIAIGARIATSHKLGWGYGDRGIADHEQLHTSPRFWATIVIGVPMVIFTFILENFGAFAVLAAAIAGFIVVNKRLNKVDKRFPSLFPLLTASFLQVIFVALGITILVASIFASIMGTAPGAADGWMLRLGVSGIMFAGAGYFGWPVIKLVAARRKASLAQNFGGLDCPVASPVPEPQASDPLQSPLRTHSTAVRTSRWGLLPSRRLSEWRR
jgi:hypothetical protein